MFALSLLAVGQCYCAHFLAGAARLLYLSHFYQSRLGCHRGNAKESSLRELSRLKVHSAQSLHLNSLSMHFDFRLVRQVNII